MNTNDLKEILEKHKMWLNDEDGGERADLRGADLRGADLRGADMSWANMSRANMSGANMSGADMSGADLRWAKCIDLVKNLFYPLSCPEKGEYTAFKKADEKIVELRIPADAKRSSATGRKCRASKAVVISITTLDGDPAGNEVCSDHDKDFVYRVGETVEVQNFDENRWNECAPGIHHYITREEAVRH